jgi:hypothetical protein
MSSGLTSSGLTGWRFSTDVAWTLATRLLMIVNSVVAGVIVARWLGAKGVGELAVINVAVATVVQLGSFGLPSSNTYFIAQDPAHFRTAAINSLIFALTVGTLLAAALSGVASLRPAWFNFIPADLIRIAAVQIPFQLLTLIGLNILLAAGKIREFNLLDLAAQSFVLVNALLVLVVFGLGLDALVKLNTAEHSRDSRDFRFAGCYREEARAIALARGCGTVASHDRLWPQVSHLGARWRDYLSRGFAGRKSFPWR